MVNPVIVVYNQKLEKIEGVEETILMISRKSFNPQGYMIEFRVYDDKEEVFFYKKFES